MAGFAAQGATFTFVGSRGNFQGAVVGISVDTPVAEVVDMTSPSDPSGHAVLVPTGEWSGGGVSLDFIATTATGDIQTIVRGVGQLTFSSPSWSVTKRAILESANTSARVGELVRGTANFRVTDYQGT
jgi:hypothetical protein